MSILISLLMQFAPYIILGLGAIAMYFGIKRRGVIQERERQVREVKRVEQKLVVLANDDSKIDAKVEEKLHEISARPVEAPPTPVSPGDVFRF